MRDFIYTEDESNLHAYACRWLDDVGLRETRWILDVKWLTVHTTYHEWID